MTLDELQKQVREYTAKGFYQDVAAASRDAQLATRAYIARTHPQSAFEGRALGGKQIIVGKYEVTASVINANVYANYFPAGIIPALSGDSFAAAGRGAGGEARPIRRAALISKAIGRPSRITTLPNWIKHYRRESSCRR